MLASGMPILNAVGSSLVAVTAFELTTAANYAASGLVHWTLSALFVAGGCSAVCSEPAPPRPSPPGRVH